MPEKRAIPNDYIMSKEITYEEAVRRMEALCSAGEHCCHDIRTKMEKSGIPAPQTEQAIRHLQEERYIDERRFARAFALDKLRYNHWGRLKIAQAMRMLHIGDADIRHGLEAIDEAEYAAILERVTEQKCRQLRDADPYVRRCKLVRHAVGRGFETDEAMQAAGRFAGKQPD